jgi:hypothetical protein
MQVNIARGEARAVEAKLIRDAYELWIAKVKSGEVRARGGAEYKAGVVRSYELAWTGRLLQRFGRIKVAELRRAQVQGWVDELVAAGLAAQTVRKLVNALRVMLKWAVRAELIAKHPCDGLEGELMALRANRVDLVERTITVDADRGSYDPRIQTFGKPKSRPARARRASRSSWSRTWRR